jgi:hypothetical protein
LVNPTLTLTPKQKKELSAREREAGAPSFFSYGYLDPENRQKILEHLKEGKRLRCHHQNCPNFNSEFITLYEYNRHCHSNHPKQPLHPSLQYIEDLNRTEFIVNEKPWKKPQLQSRGNPWE